MSDNRSTQFQGFAKALTEEILMELKYSVGRTSQDIKKRLEDIVARRAYDLVDITICHIAMGMSNDSAVMFVPRQNAVNYIPDLPELPKEQE